MHTKENNRALSPTTITILYKNIPEINLIQGNHKKILIIKKSPDDFIVW